MLTYDLANDLQYLNMTSGLYKLSFIHNFLFLCTNALQIVDKANIYTELDMQISVLNYEYQRFEELY